MRDVFADVTLAPGAGQPQTFRVEQVEQWQVDQSVDNDTDSFSLDVGDVAGVLLGMLDRDTEVRVRMYERDLSGTPQPVFSGLVNVEQFVTDKTHTMQGSDTPSAILTATDATPNYWKHANPRTDVILARARQLGVDVDCITMAQIGRLWTDGSEKEWSFWYRIARMRNAYMWTLNNGRLQIGYLSYSPLGYDYSIGNTPRGESSANWIPVSDVAASSNKATRLEKVFVYGQDKKDKSKGPIAIATNPPGASINGWLRRPNSYSTLSTSRKLSDINVEAQSEMFESIVGAQEHQVTVSDSGISIQQNKTARVNLPAYGLVGLYYVVGVSRNDGPSGFNQVVRLREPNFALPHRTPDAPALKNQPVTGSDKSITDVGATLNNSGDGIRYAESFSRWAKLVFPNWPYSFILGVLVSISAKETGGTFKNGREYKHIAEYIDWFPFPTSTNNIHLPAIFGNGTVPISLLDVQNEWKSLFANSAGNRLNPFSREAGLGPMALTELSLKTRADGYGWNGVPNSTNGQGTFEYAGGRWNPDSNIHVGAEALLAWCEQLGVTPTQPQYIWNAVAAFNGGNSWRDATPQKYAADVKALFDSTYGPDAQAAVGEAPTTKPGSATRTFQIPGYGALQLPKNTPDEVAKAITYGMSLLGSPYLWGGSGQIDKAAGQAYNVTGVDYNTIGKGTGKAMFDCASFVNYCISSASPRIRALLGLPSPETGHVQSTYTLWSNAPFGHPSRDSILPGDLLHWNGKDGENDHVGLYMGDGLMIEDPHTGDVVKVVSCTSGYYDMAGKSYYGASRYFIWGTN